MPTYLVEVPAKGWLSFLVKANTKKEAKKKVDNLDRDIEVFEAEMNRSGKAKSADIFKD